MSQALWRRKVYVLLDANCATNPAVQAALNALVRQLLQQRADVQVLDLPGLDGVNGPDDFLDCRKSSDDIYHLG